MTRPPDDPGAPLPPDDPDTPAPAGVAPAPPSPGAADPASPAEGTPAAANGDRGAASAASAADGADGAAPAAIGPRPAAPLAVSAPAPRPSALRRYGPITGVLAVFALVAALSVISDDEGGGEPAAPEVADPTGELPDGVVTWSLAQQQDLDVTFPDTCDTETGRVAVPFFFRSECVADAEGDNGGATAPGVTGDTITVVAWLPNESDPVYGIIRQALGFDDSVDEIRETYEGLAEVFQDYYQTYGRTVELEFVEASGTMLDPVSARADAVQAAELDPFVVLGGPLLAGSWSEELHARDIACIACPAGEKPTSFGIQPNLSQIRDHVAAYVDAKLAGRPAEFAGADLQGEDRTFGLLYLAQSQSEVDSAGRMTEALADVGVDVAETVTFPLDPGRAQELAASAVARFEEAGVTTVITRADPISLPAFTREASEQGWFPEWFLAGYPFSDSSTFARGFDQEQWQHAFGISFLPPAAPPELNPAYQLYDWYHGEPPPADESLILTYPQVALLFTALGYAGPELTTESLRDGLFAVPPTPTAVTQPSVDYGTELWGREDYAGIDDMVEIWWDPDAEGVDETGNDGLGLYRYVDGGVRSMPEDYTSDVHLFDPDGAVTRITDPPEAEVPPDYPPPDGA